MCAGAHYIIPFILKQSHFSLYILGQFWPNCITLLLVCRYNACLENFCFIFSVEQWVSTDHGGSLYNGDTQVIYWADVSSEIAFVVPTANNVSGTILGTDTDRPDLNISFNSSNSSITSGSLSQQQTSSMTSCKKSCILLQCTMFF